MGEAGAAYNSGAPPVTDAFVSIFWYLDALGNAAVHGFGGWCRQTLVGGNYSLLSTNTFVPHPDYYAALLWRTLMGSTVLSARQGPPAVPALRTYAHCSPPRAGPPYNLRPPRFRTTCSTVELSSACVFLAPAPINAPN